MKVEWTRCSANLPPEGEKVLAYKNGVYALGYRKELRDALFFSPDEIFWTSLPNPPEGA